MLLFIIFGTRGLSFGKETGQFHCPGCRTDSTYRRKVQRRFFTLYFIPLIPLDKMAEYIECERCKGTFSLEVLELAPSTQQVNNEFHDAMKRVLVQTMMSKGTINESQLASTQQIYSEIVGRQVSAREIQDEVTVIQADGISADRYLGQFARSLTADSKRMVLDAAYCVALADGGIDAAEQATIEQFGQALLLSREEFVQIMESIAAQRG